MTTRYNYNVGQLGPDHYQSISNDRNRAGGDLHRLLLTAQSSDVQFSNNELYMGGYHIHGHGSDISNVADSVMRRNFNYDTTFDSTNIIQRPLGLNMLPGHGEYFDINDPQPSIRDDDFSTSAAQSADGKHEMYQEVGEDEGGLDGSDDIDNMVSTVKHLDVPVDIENVAIDSLTTSTAAEIKQQGDNEGKEPETNPEDPNKPINEQVAHFDRSGPLDGTVAFTTDARNSSVTTADFGGVQVVKLDWRSDRTVVRFSPPIAGTLPAQVTCELTIREASDISGITERLLDKTTKTITTSNDFVYELPQWKDADWKCSLLEDKKPKQVNIDNRLELYYPPDDILPNREGFADKFFFLLTITVTNGLTPDKIRDKSARWNRMLYLIRPSEMWRSNGTWDAKEYHNCLRKRGIRLAHISINGVVKQLSDKEVNQQGAGVAIKKKTPRKRKSRAKPMPKKAKKAKNVKIEKIDLSLNQVGGCHGDKKCAPCGK